MIKTSKLHQDPGLCHQRLDTESVILGSFCMWDFWQILYAKLSDLPFWSLFVRKLYPILVATIIVYWKVSNIKNRVFHP